jgi:hypothetical protein
MLYNNTSAVGWVDIGIRTKVPLEFVCLSKIRRKKMKTVF